MHRSGKKATKVNRYSICLLRRHAEINEKIKEGSENCSSTMYASLPLATIPMVTTGCLSRTFYANDDPQMLMTRPHLPSQFCYSS